MDVPPEIAFRGLEPSDALKERVLEGIADLEEVHDRLVSCRVMVEDTTPSRVSGKIYRVRLDIGIPSRTVVVDWKPEDADDARDVSQAIHHAFGVGRRKLDQLKDKDGPRGRATELPPHGRVAKLLTTPEGVRYGFLLSREGREIYFHENALVGVAYDDLKVGDEVRFHERMGDEGPLASTVAPLEGDRIGPHQEESVPLRSVEPGD
jgi:cold shock CspA family protein